MIETILRTIIWPVLKGLAFFWSISGRAKWKERARTAQKDARKANALSQEYANAAASSRDDVINGLSARADRKS